MASSADIYSECPVQMDLERPLFTRAAVDTRDAVFRAPLLGVTGYENEQR